jgi:hypothetical protein
MGLSFATGFVLLMLINVLSIYGTGAFGLPSSALRERHTARWRLPENRKPVRGAAVKFHSFIG